MIKRSTKKLVSIIIPTLNNSSTLRDCYEGIKNQSYKDIEIIQVDGFSKDDSVKIGKKYGARTYIYGPDQSKGRVFGAPYQRNYGVKRARGKYVYYMDADMIPTRNVIKECVNHAEKGYKAVIIREDSFGDSFWADCKKLERRAYFGDDNVEAPRFFEKKTWDELGGLNDRLGADDWDIYDRFKAKGYKASRITAIVKHNEGKLSLIKLMKKRYLYGRSIRAYVTRHAENSSRHFFVRFGFLKNWKTLVGDPIHLFGMIIMRFVEYLAGFLGILSTFVIPQKVQLQSGK